MHGGNKFFWPISEAYPSRIISIVSPVKIFIDWPLVSPSDLHLNRYHTRNLDLSVILTGGAHEPVLKRCGIINTLTIGSREWGGVVLPIFTVAWQWWIGNKDYLQSIKFQLFYYQVYAFWSDLEVMLERHTWWKLTCSFLQQISSGN